MSGATKLLTPSGGGVILTPASSIASDVTVNVPSVNGTLNMSGAVNEVPAGTASAPAIYTTGDTNTGVFFPAANTVAVATDGLERMRIDSSGNLNIGQTGGYGGITLQKVGSTNAYLWINSTNTGYYYAQFEYNAGGRIGSITTNGSSVAYNTSSDYRLKENIQPMQNALGVVAQLNPVTYNWKADGSEGQGFIAHELQAVVPDCVTGEKDAVDAEGKPVYQGIDTSFLVATLTKAIQELSAKNDLLEARLTALEAK